VGTGCLPSEVALSPQGGGPDQSVDTLGRDGLTAFLGDLPTRSVTLDLRRDKHAQGQQQWEPNDLNDMVALPIAAVYCDVVVTERQWVNRMRRAGVAQRFETRLIADLAGVSWLFD
jgi:hypothetical protein